MGLIESLTELIKSQYLIHPGGKLVLREESKNATCKYVKLKTSGKVLVLKFDIDGPEITPYFEQGKTNAKCDSIVITSHNKKIYVFLCELKSGSGNEIDQINAGMIISQYIIKTAKRVHSNININNVEYRSLIFTGKYAPKGKTNPRKDIYEQNQMGLKYLYRGCNQEYNLSSYCCN